MKQRGYIFALDAVRALAILGVVAIHVWNPIYSRPDFLGGFSWWLAYAINAFSRIGVPWFLMVSGALLLSRRPKQEAKDILNRLIWRLGLPLVFWSAVYFWWENQYYGRLSSGKEALGILFSGNVFHLYFLVILIGLYAGLAWWRRIRISKIWLGGSFAWGILLYGLQFWLFKDRSIFNFLTLWVPYLGYFLAGAYFFQLKSGKREQRTALAIWLGAGIITIFGGYFNLKLFGKNILIGWGAGGSEYLTNWLAPNVILLALSGFYAAVKAKWPRPVWFRMIVRQLARASLGIYLVHMLVINILDKYAGLYLDFQSEKLWIWGIKKTAAVLVVSWAVTEIIRQLPIARSLIGEKQQ